MVEVVVCRAKRSRCDGKKDEAKVCVEWEVKRRRE